jgi:hypothetical protein
MIVMRSIKHKLVRLSIAKRTPRKAVDSLIRSVVKKALIQKGGHPHVMRHTFATTLLDHGMDLQTVQALMGLFAYSDHGTRSSFFRRQKVGGNREFAIRGLKRVRGGNFLSKGNISTEDFFFEQSLDLSPKTVDATVTNKQWGQSHTKQE